MKAERHLTTTDQSSSTVLAAAFLSRALSLEKAISIGLKSGEYGGRNRSRAPTISMASRTPLILWAGRFSMTTMSPGRENLLGIGKERGAVHRAVEQHRRRHPGQPQTGSECGCLPMAVGNGRPASLTARRSSSQPGHLR